MLSSFPLRRCDFVTYGVRNVTRTGVGLMHPMSVTNPISRVADGEARLVDVDECRIYISDVIVALWQPLVFERERDDVCEEVMAVLVEAGADMDLEPMLLDDYSNSEGKTGFVYIFGVKDE